MLTIDAIKKLDVKTQEVLFRAQLAELVERRKVRDAALFEHCFIQEAPDDGNGFVDWIDDFQDIAGVAFQTYHALRKKNARIDPDTGELVIPDPATADDADAAPAGDDAELNPDVDQTIDTDTAE